MGKNRPDVGRNVAKSADRHWVNAADAASSGPTPVAWLTKKRGPFRGPVEIEGACAPSPARLRASVARRGLVGIHVRSSDDERVEFGQDLRIGRRRVGLGVLPVVPEADELRALRIDERHFLLEAVLLPQQRKDVLLEDV